ncbi:hypothetical protein EGP98_03335 [bacterium]|nr:hypothetical protein [bacterium]
MEIVTVFNEKEIKINLNNNAIFFGKNTTVKNKFISELIEKLLKNSKELEINGRQFNNSDYNIINIDENTDFSSEFKFTKNNTLKKLIYSDIEKKIDERKIIDCTNEIFDVIDDKVNSLLNRKINKKSDNNITFQIEIPNMYLIIDKFTNIYVDNILLSDKEISKSMKRKLLYQLYFLDIKSLVDKPTIVIINNFDVYLNSDEIISVLNSINNLSSDNCHFIISSCNNIFEYLDINNFSVYKISNEVISINRMDKSIKNFLIKEEYNQKNKDIPFDEFYSNNEGLISNIEVNKIKENVFTRMPSAFGKILNSDNIKIMTNKPKNIISEYIICANKKDKKLFEEIVQEFIDH